MTLARTIPHAGALLVLLVGEANLARAQDPLYLIDDETSVVRVDFRFPRTETFRPATLKAQISTAAPGYFQRGWRASVLSALPVIPKAGPFHFSPIELQKDVIRLERFYDRNGFPHASADYEVELDSSRNRVDVLFVIDEGGPLKIDSLRFAGSGGGSVVDQLDDELKEDWYEFSDRILLENGERLDQNRLSVLQSRTVEWLQDRGYAFANASTETRVDSTGLLADVNVKLNVGPRGHFGEIYVDGAESVAPIIVRRELPFQSGDLFRRRDLMEGQRQAFGLNLFQLAAVDIAPDQPQDSTVDIVVRVREGPARFINALTGYYSDGGITGSAQWTHRNFLGGARSFTASLNAQTGVGAVGSYSVTDYEARASLRQPYVFDRRLSGTIEPFARVRDDIIEVSTQYGATGSLLYEYDPLKTASLAVTISAREVGADSLSLVDPSTLLPGGVFRITRSQLRLSGILGFVDNPLNPTSGVVLRPSISGAGLLFSGASYASVGLGATGYVPLGDRSGLVIRGSGGKLIAAGSTDPADAEDYLDLRNELFYAGGTTDVRGWAGNLLGPKFLDFTRVDTSVAFAPGDDLDAYYTDRYGVRYRPVGAEARVSASAQLNVPLPLGEQWGASLFVDAGRVWRPAEGLYELFGHATPEFPNLPALITRFRQDEESIRFGTGAGIQYLTPVGFISVALGLKLNPSFFDLRDPRAVLLEADIEGLSLAAPDFDAIPAEWSRRLQFHFSIAQRF